MAEADISVQCLALVEAVVEILALYQGVSKELDGTWVLYQVVLAAVAGIWVLCLVVSVARAGILVQHQVDLVAYADGTLVLYQDV